MTKDNPYIISLKKKLSNGDVKDEWGSLKHHAEDLAENNPEDFFGMLDDFIASDAVNVHILCAFIEIYLGGIDKSLLENKAIMIFRNQSINRRRREQVIDSLKYLILQD